MLIEASHLKKDIEPDKEVGSLDVLPGNELLAGFERLRNGLAAPLIIESFVSKKARDDHVQICGNRFFKARIDVIGLPRVVVVEDGDEPQVRLPHDQPVTMQLVNAGIPRAGRSLKRAPIPQHRHWNAATAIGLERFRQVCKRGIGKLVFRLIDNDYQPVGQT